MLAVKLLNGGLGLFAVGFVLIAASTALGHDDSVALAIGLLMPYLSILTLLLVGLCGLLAAAHSMRRMVLASARLRRSCP